MHNVIFAGDAYDTPSSVKIHWLAKFLPSLYFYWNIQNVVRHDGRLAMAGKYGDWEWCEGSLNTVKALESTGISMHVRGMNNIDAADGPCVLIGNHMSTLETFVLPVFIQPRKKVTFVVKESLLKYPWFGPVLGSRDPIVVSRINPRVDFEAVLKGGQERLSRGTSIIVFPQNTRSSRMEPSQFNSIGIKLAKRAKVPVIPIALQTDAWGVGKIIKDAGPVNTALPVRFAFGEPFTVTGNGKSEQTRVVEFIARHLQEWRNEA